MAVLVAALSSIVMDGAGRCCCFNMLFGERSCETLFGMLKDHSLLGTNAMSCRVYWFWVVGVRALSGKPSFIRQSTIIISATKASRSSMARPLVCTAPAGSLCGLSRSC